MITNPNYQREWTQKQVDAYHKRMQALITQRNHIRIPPNRDRFYPDNLHIADHTPDEPIFEEECPHCRRPGRYCICP